MDTSPVLVRLWLEKSTRTAEEAEKPLLPAMANSHSKNGPAFSRPSELFTQNTKARFGTKCSNYDKFEQEEYQQARSVHKDLR